MLLKVPVLPLVLDVPVRLFLWADSSFALIFAYHPFLWEYLVRCYKDSLFDKVTRFLSFPAFPCLAFG